MHSGGGVVVPVDHRGGLYTVLKKWGLGGRQAGNVVWVGKRVREAV